MEDEFEFEATQELEEQFDGPQGDLNSMSASPAPPTPTASVASASETAMPRRTSSDGGAMARASAPSEATNKWKLENDSKVKQRDAEFAKAKQELQKKAEAALAKIRSERSVHIAKNAKENREAQSKAQAASSTKQDPNAPVNWKKLAELVDLDKETTDRERMRLLFKAKVTESK